MATILATKKCNLRCHHCVRDEYNTEMLDVGILERFIIDCNNYDKKHVHHCITGGEPTMYSHLDDALKMISGLKHTTSIITNGQENVDIIINNKSSVNGVWVSLDSGVEEVNDNVRGKGTYKKAISFTQSLLKNGIKTDFKICLNKQNCDTIEDIFKLARKLNVSTLAFSAMIPIEKGIEYDLNPDRKSMIDAYNSILKYKQTYKIKTVMNVRHFTPFLMPDWIYCNPMKGILHSLSILPNADIGFCCDLIDHDIISDIKHHNPLPITIGNYNELGFDDIVSNKKQRINVLKHRRLMDFANDKLTGNRSLICENCKFYHSL